MSINISLGLGLEIGVQLAGRGGDGIAQYDAFTDENDVPLADHSPIWTVNHGAYDIQSNRANHVSSGAKSFAAATVQSGLSDATVSVIVNPVSSGTLAGLVVRATDIDNCYVVYLDLVNQGVRILKREGGSASVLKTTSMTLVEDIDYVLEVTLSGNDITATVDGANTVTASNAFNNTATRHGLYAQNPGTRFDEFQVARASQQASYLRVADCLFDNGYDTDQTTHLESSPFARWVFKTTATHMLLKSYNNLYSIFGKWADIGVVVNGEYYTTLSATADGEAIFNVDLPAGTERVELIAGLQNKTASPLKGTFPKSVYFSGGAATQVTPTIGTNRLLIYGDSITSGGNAGTPTAEAWAVLLRDMRGDVALEAWGGRRLRENSFNEPTLNSFVEQMASYEPAVIWMAIGTNDYGGDQWSAADFGAAYASLLDKLHTELPDTVIYCQTPITRTTETANDFGDTLDDYRAAIADAVSTRTDYATLVDGTAWTIDLADGLHPSTAGHATYAAEVAAALGLE